MEPQTILYIIIGITVLTYVFEQVLDLLNLKARRADLPYEVAAFYDRNKYLRSLDYHRDLTRFSFLTSALSVIASLAMLWLGGFGWIDNALKPHIDPIIPRALAFFGVLMLGSDILTTPFQLYRTFVIEERYGFN